VPIGRQLMTCSSFEEVDTVQDREAVSKISVSRPVTHRDEQVRSSATAPTRSMQSRFFLGFNDLLALLLSGAAV